MHVYSVLYIYIYVYIYIYIYIYMYTCMYTYVLFTIIRISHITIMFIIIIIITNRPHKYIGGCVWLLLQARNVNFCFTELAERYCGFVSQH